MMKINEVLTLDNQLEKIGALLLHNWRFVTMTVVDNGEMFDIYYHFDLDYELMTYKLELKKGDTLPSISGVCFAAVVVENEIQDLFGITITGLEFRSVKPPEALTYHFNQVNAAYVEKETKIQEANQYREKVIPDAKASADKLVNDAQIRRSEQLTTANDRVAEFYGLFEEYQRNRDVVWERVYREKVTKILNKMGGKIVLPDGDGTPQIFLPCPSSSSQ